MRGRDITRFKCWHPEWCTGTCQGCKLTLDWAIWRQVCHCGVPATGYRSMSPDAEVEFFCEAHFQDVPTGATVEP